MTPAFLVAVVLLVAALVAFHDRRRSRAELSSRLVPPDEADGSMHPGEGWPSAPGDKGEGLNDVAMMLELVASMLDAGAGIGRALELIARSSVPSVGASLKPVVAALSIGADWDTAWQLPLQPAPEVVRLRDALAFAALTGAPSASILYAQAARERREQFRAAEKRAAALGVKLVVPLGLCSLPAFICLGIVPVLIAMLPAG